MLFSGYPHIIVMLEIFPTPWYIITSYNELNQAVFCGEIFHGAMQIEFCSHDVSKFLKILFKKVPSSYMDTDKYN